MAKKKAAAPPTDTTNKTHVCVVLDRSGSMSSTRAGTISGFNEYVNGLRADKQTEYTLTLIQFDSAATGPDLTLTFQDQPLAAVKELTTADYEPRGMTPLYDAIGECIRRTDAKGRAVIVLIITDGAENASLEFTKESIKDLIAKKTAEGWTFTFVGADIDSYSAGAAIGASASNTANYSKGMEGALYSNLAQSTMLRSEQARSMGVQAAVSMSFISDQQRAAMVAPQTTTTGPVTPGATWGGTPQGFTVHSVTPLDPFTVIPSPGCSPAQPTIIPLTAGAQTRPANFPIATHLVRKPRAWRTSTDGAPVS